MMFSRPKDEWSTIGHDENSFDLHEAAMRNNLRRVKALIEANKVPVAGVLATHHCLKQHMLVA